MAEKEGFNGAEFLKEKYWSDEGFRDSVERHSETGKNPAERIDEYLTRIIKAGERKGSLLKETALYPQLIIKEEDISQDYLKNILLGNLAERMGYTPAELRDPQIREVVIRAFEEQTGGSFESYEVPSQELALLKEQIIGDQKASLDRWFDYLTSEEARNYPQAFRYWAFAQAMKMGAYDPVNKRYNKRDKDTAAPFPELDQQALSIVFEELINHISDKPIKLTLTPEQNEQLTKLLESANFSRLYAWALEHVKSLKTPEDRLAIIEGEWRCFKKGSNPQDLTKSLQQHHTGWCIANNSTAASYLSHSDVWVYYSQDENGQNTVPRSAIVTGQNGITEVRGIYNTKQANQHLDSYIIPVVEKNWLNCHQGNDGRRRLGILDY